MRPTFPPCPLDRARRGPAAGYTLMELLTVVFLIGLLATMALPRLDVSSYRTDQGMHQVGTVMLTAQRAAVMKQHDVVVAFDSANNRLRVHDDLNNDGAMDAGERIVYQPLGDGVVFGRGGAPAQAIGAGPITFTRLQGGLKAVTFLRNGSASEEGGVYLTSRRAAMVAGREKDARLVLVSRATGRASWLTYTSGQWKTEF